MFINIQTMMITWHVEQASEPSQAPVESSKQKGWAIFKRAPQNKKRSKLREPSSSMSFWWAASSIDMPIGTWMVFSTPSLSTKVTEILYDKTFLSEFYVHH